MPKESTMDKFYREELEAELGKLHASAVVAINAIEHELKLVRGELEGENSTPGLEFAIAAFIHQSAVLEGLGVLDADIVDRIIIAMENKAHEETSSLS